jgi:hypothetical protein
MFQLFSPPHSFSFFVGKVRRPQVTSAGTACFDAATRPDFDLSDFDESPPTVPGGYWHVEDGSKDKKLS